MKRLYVIVGPTASGKTAAAIELAKALGTEILSCDSRQFYRELDIGVARPSLAELSAVRHHFIANRSVLNPYNVYDYEHEALQLLSTLFKEHDAVVAVGGSGLYIDALCTGVDLMPDPAPGLRQQLSEKIKNGKTAELLDELRRRDPDTYSRIDRRNPIRIQRALEVVITAGRPMSEAVTRRSVERPFEVVKIGIHSEPSDLRSRIDSRVDAMVAAGLEDEVRGLLSYRHLNTLNTVGYKEIFEYLDGAVEESEAIESIKAHTWRYARKQLTWLRRYSDIHWVEQKGAAEKMQEIAGESN